VARLLQTLSSCRTEYFGMLGMVNVSFGSISSARPTADHFRSSPNCGHHALGPPLPKSAKLGSAPVFNASSIDGARGERITRFSRPLRPSIRHRARCFEKLPADSENRPS